jgi:putative GTP pyrophosphokinase
MSSEIMNLEQASQWHADNKELYTELCHHIKGIVLGLIRQNNLSFHEVDSRCKHLQSFKEKYKEKKYSDVTQMTDVAGLRITVYLLSELTAISTLVETAFDIDSKNSGDHSEKLDVNKVGYKSVHYVAALPQSLVAHPLYARFDGIKFEIQLRTILQHAWAEIEHDRRYKFGIKLPNHLKRRFALMAGLLEVADNELDNIAMDIERYGNEVTRKSKSGNLDIPIDSTSLVKYFNNKYTSDSRFKPESSPIAEFLFKDLEEAGVKTLNDLDELINEDVDRLLSVVDTEINLYMIVHSALVIKNAEAYFAANKGEVFSYSRKELDVLRELGIDLMKLGVQYYVED